jgi:hypothetical protein
MAPNWMATVKSFTNSSCWIPMMVDPMIMWPVLETGRYSVIPSMMARMIA